MAKKLNALERGVILDHLQRAGIIDILKHSKAAIDRYLKELPSDRPRDRDARYQVVPESCGQQGRQGSGEVRLEVQACQPN